MTDLAHINHSKLPDLLARRFLQMDALCPFLPEAKLAKLMEKVGIWPPSGKWKADEIPAIRKGFTTPGLYENDVLQPELRHRLIQQAVQDKKLLPNVLDMMNQLPKSSDMLMYLARQKVFFALYSNIPIPEKIDDGQVAMVISQSLHALPFQLNWFLEKTPYRQTFILSVMVQDLILYCTVWPTAAMLLDAIGKGRCSPPPASIISGFVQLFRNKRLSTARLKALAPIDTMTLIALDQLLHEDYAAALKIQLEARRLWRKGTRNRLAELPVFGSLVLQTARLGSGVELPDMHRECSSLLRDNVQTLHGGTGFFALLEMLSSRMVTGSERDDLPHRYWIERHAPHADLVSRLLYAHACTLHEDKDWVEPCAELRNRLAPVLPIAAAILDDALTTAGEKSLGLNVPHPDFRRLIVIREPWERQLEALTTLLAAPEKEKKEKPKRLAWMLDPISYEVFPKMQTYTAKGTWTMGQRFAVKHLVGPEAEKLEWLTPHDHKMSAAFVQHSSSYYGEGSWKFVPERGLPLLCGHPLIFHAHSGEHISLEQRPVELIITEKPKGCEVRLTATSRGLNVQLLKVDENTWAVLLFDEKTASISRILEKDTGKKRDKMIMPREALPRLLELAQQSTLPLRLELKAEEQAGETLPVVQLRQQGAGFAAALFVRPLKTQGIEGSGASGAVFRPGQGPADPMAMVDGRPLRLLRDFAAEREAAERLLAACPTLAASFEDGRWFSNDLEEFLQVLTELQKAAALCRVEWPEGERLRLVGTLSPAQVRVRANKGSAGEWFSLSGEVQIDEEHVLALGEVLDQLSGGHGRFVELAPGEFFALTEEARRSLKRLQLLAFERKTGRGKKSDLMLHPLAGPAVDEACASMNFERDVSWQAALGRMSDALSMNPEIPRSLQAELRPYQKEGFIWLARLAHWGVGGCLADDMGLGKTVQSIAVMLHEATKGPCLVIAPTSVCPNWEAELTRFAPDLAVYRLRDAASGKRENIVAQMGPGMVLIAGYGLLHIERKALSAQHWSMVIFDEAQALKNDATKRTRAAASIPADFRLVLTGTPIENHLDDLWSLFNIINPGLLGTSHPEFHRRFAGAAQGGQSASALKLLTRPFILRRLKSQVLDDLPSRTEQTLLIEPDEREQSLYEALRRQAVEHLEAQQEAGKHSRINILAELTRLRLACCHASLAEKRLSGKTDEESAKMRCFLDLLEEARESGHRLLVFSQFVGFLSLVRAMLDKRGIRYQYLDGATPEETRRKRVAAFQAGEGDAFLISLKAGGQGLNLTAADYVVHLDPWWNPAVEDQATDRAHRIGQERPVTVYRLVMAHSVEEKILALHAKKRELAADFLEGTDTAATGADILSEEELLALMQ